MKGIPVGLTIFFSVAFAAIVAMIVTSGPRHPHLAAATPVSPSNTRAAADPERTSTFTRGVVAPPRGSRGVAEADDQSEGMRMPPGYRASNARNMMRMRLRELMMAEEQYYNESQAYTTDLSKLMLARRTGDVVALRVSFAGPAGWSAEATHPAMGTKTCVIYAGPATSLPRVPETFVDHTQPLGERDLVCDKD